jgi:hypothetical protein
MMGFAKGSTHPTRWGGPTLRLLDTPAPQALECLELAIQVKALRDNHVHPAIQAFRSNWKYRRAKEKHTAAPMDQAGATLSVRTNALSCVPFQPST